MKINIFVPFLIALTLCACGGGGGSSSPSGGSPINANTPPVGFYVGTSSDGNDATVLSLSDGTYWIMESPATGINLDYLLTGTAQYDNGSYNSKLTTDYQLPTTAVTAGSVTSGTMFGNFSGPQFTDQIIINSNIINITASYDQSISGSADVNQLDGTYGCQATMTDPGTQGNPDTFLIQPGGVLTGQYTYGGSTNNYSGSITARTDVDAYNITLIYGGNVYQGIVYLDTVNKLVRIIAINQSQKIAYSCTANT